jgi:putative DNA primase/helicase
VVKTILATNIPTFKEGTTTGVRLSRATPQSLYVDLTKSARYVKYDGRSKSLVDHDCPTDVAASYLALGAWGLPHLTGLINAPTLRPDGSFLDMPGYDRGTGLLYIGDGTVYPGLPRKRERLVTLKDAKAALPVLDELLCGFPFVSKADKAVALSAILTACIRRSLPSAPLHAFTAPTPGTGKSLLVDMIAMMTEGRKAAVLSPGENAAEFEKRLNAALLSGDLIIAIDNIARPLEGELLCSALTQDVVRIRPLGETTLVAVPSNSMILANGNNLRIVGDMTRRAIMCTIDAGCERPEQREFPRTPVEMVQADRGRYVMAALTVLKAYKDQTCLQDYVPAFGSFTAWSTWVRGALIWVGAGDPCETMETIRANDATRITHQAVVAAWWAAFADKEVLAKELCGDVDMDTLAMSPLHEALTAAVNGRGGLTARQVGGWLSAKENTIVDGLKIVKGWHSAQKVATWRLFKL